MAVRLGNDWFPAGQQVEERRKKKKKKAGKRHGRGTVCKSAKVITRITGVAWLIHPAGSAIWGPGEWGELEVESVIQHLASVIASDTRPSSSRLSAAAALGCK